MKRLQEVIVLRNVSAAFGDSSGQYVPDPLRLPSRAASVPSLDLLRIASVRRISVGEADRYKPSSGHNARSDWSFSMHQDRSVFCRRKPCSNC